MFIPKRNHDIFIIKNRVLIIKVCTHEETQYDDNYKKIQPEQLLFRRWEIYPATFLNGKYFVLDNTPSQHKGLF
ncbi:MAG: hypothetical protein GYA75_03620 [Bacteroidales bacterium]|nr:hypothetical protein [Bacteroidales bacterium]